jgi:hypothetical protein
VVVLTVGADESEQIARRQIEFDRLDGERFAVFLRQVLSLDHGKTVAIWLKRQRQNDDFPGEMAVGRWLCEGF